MGLPTRCHAIDTWRGDPHTGAYGEEVFAGLRREHDPPYGAFSTLVQSDLDAAARSFETAQIDFLHIDGLHTYEAVRHDWETWRPKLSETAVVLFHDTAERTQDFGVWRLWKELSPQHLSFNFEHSHGLGVLAAGGSPPHALSEFLTYANAHADHVRGLFSRLGERLTSRRTTMKMLELVGQWRQVAGEWHRRTGARLYRRSPLPPTATPPIGTPSATVWPPGARHTRSPRTACGCGCSTRNWKPRTSG